MDVEPNSFCLSSELLWQRLRNEPDISGALPVHIYDLACDVESLEDICREHGVTLVYDAAQAFGSCYKGRSLLGYSICGFLATKIFHTAEGGCVISPSAEAHKALSLARALALINDDHYNLGINGKMSELHAAMGLAFWDGTDAEIEWRKQLYAVYGEALKDLRPIRPAVREGLEWNYAYYPILLPDERCRSRVERFLSVQNIHPRRYFYLSLNTLSYLKSEWRSPCTVAEDAAKRVLCLPMYGELRRKMSCIWHKAYSQHYVMAYRRFNNGSYFSLH